MNRAEILGAVISSEEVDSSIIIDYIKHSDVEDFINDIEGVVNEAKSLLAEVEGVGTLHKIKDTYDKLEQLSSDLY